MGSGHVSDHFPLHAAEIATKRVWWLAGVSSRMGSSFSFKLASDEMENKENEVWGAGEG